MRTQRSGGAILRLVWLAVRIFTPIAIGGCCLWAVATSLAPLALQDLGQALTSLHAWQWITAIIASGLSFVALARYDLVMHRHFQTNIPDHHAAISGAAAIAIGQTIGMGIISGAFARWRMLPNISLSMTTKISGAVAVTFILGMLFAIGLFGLFGDLEIFSKRIAFLMILVFLIILIMLFLNPQFYFFEHHFDMPTVKALMSMAILTAVDLICAGTALWLLLPPGTELSLMTLLPAYALALGAAVLSGAPGGVGPFELVLFMLLPQVPDQDVLVAIISYRLVYYALPAILATCMLFRAFPSSPVRDKRLADVRDHDLAGQNHAEFGLLRQREAKVLLGRDARIGVVLTGQSICALFGPLRGSLKECLQAIQHAAIRRNTTALLYKVSARSACVARKMGWSIVHVADDMVIDLQKFSTNGPRCRQLRRKLRQAEKSGVVTGEVAATDWKGMQTLDQTWQIANGEARSVTMGVFCPHYLGHQKVFVARQNGRQVGFASFHQSPDELCLDLMRSDPNAPPGTMHALIFAAVTFGQNHNMRRLSLAAVPPQTGWLGRISHRFEKKGLLQFKSSFAPTRVPLFAASPTTIGLWFALADLWRAKHRPNPKNAHIHDEDYEFDYTRNA